MIEDDDGVVIVMLAMMMAMMTTETFDRLAVEIRSPAVCH